MKYLTLSLALIAALLLGSGCAINIHNTQNTKGGTTAEQSSGESAASTNTKADAKANGTAKTSVKIKHGAKANAKGKAKIKIKLSKKASTSISTATKYKKGREKLKTGGKVKGKSLAKGKVKLTATLRGKGSAKGKVKVSTQNRNKDKNKDKDKGKDKGKRTGKKDDTATETSSETENEIEEAEEVEPEVIEYQDPPEEPSENEFGYEDPIYGCFEGEVMFIEPDSKKLPKDYNQYEVSSVLYACEWDIAPRSFDQGFPGVENQFEWFAIRYSGSFAIETGGKYIFRLVSDDGARLYIDGKQVINNDGVHATKSKQGVVHLDAGDHEMVLEYFQGPRYYIALQLFVTPPDGEEGIFSVR